MTHFKRFN